jgi:hypothetical protein
VAWQIRGSITNNGKRFFLFSKPFKLHLELTKPPVLWLLA